MRWNISRRLTRCCKEAGRRSRLATTDYRPGIRRATCLDDPLAEISAASMGFWPHLEQIRRLACCSWPAPSHCILRFEGRLLADWRPCWSQLNQRSLPLADHRSATLAVAPLHLAFALAIGARSASPLADLLRRHCSWPVLVHTASVSVHGSFVNSHGSLSG